MYKHEMMQKKNYDFQMKTKNENKHYMRIKV